MLDHVFWLTGKYDLDRNFEPKGVDVTFWYELMHSCISWSIFSSILSMIEDLSTIRQKASSKAHESVLLVSPPIAGSNNGEFSLMRNAFTK